ncbi:hypothetical protein [Microbulbifer discodermiae]|uniref:hypothetical protein n=1 Tax=Microbulbifer sp. 2201CG32-9 TaxID=3232309 RepID=UPI00345C381B
MRDDTFALVLAVGLFFMVSIAAALVRWFDMELLLAIKFAVAVIITVFLCGVLSYFFEWRPLSILAAGVSLLWILGTWVLMEEPFLAPGSEWETPWHSQPWYTTWWGRWLPPVFVLAAVWYFRQRELG